MGRATPGQVALRGIRQQPENVIDGQASEQRSPMASDLVRA